MRQINRHYFTPKLYALESLFQYSKDRTAFLETYDSGISKLEVFKKIHELESASEDESTSFESVSVADDDSLSFIEILAQSGFGFSVDSVHRDKRYHRDANLELISISVGRQRRLQEDLWSSLCYELISQVWYPEPRATDN